MVTEVLEEYFRLKNERAGIEPPGADLPALPEVELPSELLAPTVVPAGG